MPERTEPGYRTAYTSHARKSGTGKLDYILRIGDRVQVCLGSHRAVLATIADIDDTTGSYLVRYCDEPRERWLPKSRVTFMPTPDVLADRIAQCRESWGRDESGVRECVKAVGWSLPEYATDFPRGLNL
jgi:hypothetical protein